jgi:hypothetical protein
VQRKPEIHGASSRAKTLSALGRGGGGGGGWEACCHPAEEDDMRRRGGGRESDGVAGTARGGRGDLARKGARATAQENLRHRSIGMELEVGGGGRVWCGDWNRGWPMAKEFGGFCAVSSLCLFFVFGKESYTYLLA